MKKFSFILVLIFLYSCSLDHSKTTAVIKKLKSKEYSTKVINNQIIKDTLELEYEIGFDSTGKQTYFVGVVGYPNNDTTWSKTNYNKKKQGNKTFFYDKNNKLQTILIKKGDTTFIYSGKDLNEPISYQIHDKKGNTESVDLLLGIKKEYKKRIFNKQGNLTYCIIKETYFPTEFDKKYLSKGERLKKEAEMLNTKIEENEYEYYKQHVKAKE